MMVLFGDSLAPEINNAAHAFSGMLQEKSFAFIDEIAPAIRGVLVRFDPLNAHPDRVYETLLKLIHDTDWYQAPANPHRKRWRLPAHYGGESGPDLANVAATLQLDEATAAEQHSQTVTRVLMLGFAPGCAYLGSLPAQWDLPRLDYVKSDMPPGSLSVAVRQTVLFATAIPTGWQTIGRTPFLSFNKHQAPYFHLSAGDEVCFEPIDHQLFLTLSAEVKQGKQIVSPERTS